MEYEKTTFLECMQFMQYLFNNFFVVRLCCYISIAIAVIQLIAFIDTKFNNKKIYKKIIKKLK